MSWFTHGLALGSWPADVDVDVESSDGYRGLEEAEACHELTDCAVLGKPLPAVTVEMSACRKGQYLVNFSPTVSGRYPFFLDQDRGARRTGPWSVTVAAADPEARMSRVNLKDLEGGGWEGEGQGGGGGEEGGREEGERHVAVAGDVVVLHVQARDGYGNANRAQCLFGVRGHLEYLRELTSRTLEHGGYSVSSLQESSPTSWPYTPEAVPEVDALLTRYCDICTRYCDICMCLSHMCYMYTYIHKREKPETRNPKPETRNPKPETRNPKPESYHPLPPTPYPLPALAGCGPSWSGRPRVHARKDASQLPRADLRPLNSHLFHCVTVTYQSVELDMVCLLNTLVLEYVCCHCGI
jgi:hypothetical protein